MINEWLDFFFFYKTTTTEKKLRMYIYTLRQIWDSTVRTGTVVPGMEKITVPGVLNTE